MNHATCVAREEFQRVLNDKERLEKENAQLKKSTSQLIRTLEWIRARHFESELKRAQFDEESG